MAKRAEASPITLEKAVSERPLTLLEKEMSISIALTEEAYPSHPELGPGLFLLEMIKKQIENLVDNEAIVAQQAFPTAQGQDYNALATELFRTENNLTPREIAVIELLTEGQANNDIAENLQISVKTVKAHLRTICIKLGCNRIQAAVAFTAHRASLIREKAKTTSR